jgi:hypothetical protein
VQHPFVCCNIVHTQFADLLFPVMHLEWPSERTLLHPLRRRPHANYGMLHLVQLRAFNAAFGHVAEAVRGEAGGRPVAHAQVAAVTNVGGYEAGAALLTRW